MSSHRRIAPVRLAVATFLALVPMVALFWPHLVHP
jgi:hypothetical protein